MKRSLVSLCSRGSAMHSCILCIKVGGVGVSEECGAPRSGTGLGLDISRSIVMTRHGGMIAVESEPGKTVFRVELPLSPPG